MGLRRSELRRIQAAASSAAWRSTPISERCRQSKIVFRMTRAVALRSRSAHLRFWAPCNRQNAARRPPDCLAPGSRQYRPESFVANAALRDALPKRDRHLRIAPRFFDRDETPAIFVTSLVLIRARWFARSSRSTIAVAAWPSNRRARHPADTDFLPPGAHIAQ